MANREMKHSGIPWIGDIPKDWEICFIKQIMRNKSIKGYPNETVLSLYRDHGVVPKDSRSDNHNVTSEDTSSYKFVEVGDFVINKMKAWQGSMAVSNYQGIISPAYYICKFISSEVNRRYIHYLLRNDTYKDEYMRLSSGLRIGQWDLNIDDFLRIKMVLPSLSEQKKIASFLDRKCSDIDEMITLQEKVVEELKAYKQSVITEAVTKGLNPDVSKKDSGVEWIGKIPEQWAVKRLKHLATEKDSLIIDGDWIESNVIEDTGIRYFTTGNIGDGVFKEQGQSYISRKTFEALNCTMVKGGDLVFSRLNYPMGRSCIIPEIYKECVVAVDNVIFRPNKDVSKKYLMYVSMCFGFQNENALIARGATMQRMSRSQLVRAYIPVPHLSEQINIAKYLDSRCSEIDSLIKIKLSKIDSLKEYKKSVIYEYVTGKKEVTE